MKSLDTSLKNLPKSPGVYLFKNKKGEIIYIGKAAVLNNRVRQYFQKKNPHDTKTMLLVQDIADLEWITLDSEIDALFLEAELVRRYLPHYNILLRDDKSTSYIRIDYKSAHPTVTVIRRPLDDGAEYFGPYFVASSVSKALRCLRRVFPFSTHTKNIPKRVCLQYHLGLCPGLEENKTSLSDYRKNLKNLTSYLRGNRQKLITQFQKEMELASKNRQFELAVRLRNQLFALKNLSKQIIFSDKEFLDISKDEGLSELAKLLSLEYPPRRIEGFDISHMSGTDNVASMVVFVNGLPLKTEYRKFKMRLPGNDDFAHMREVIRRRLSDKNRKVWGMPNLILIDGGKGQLSAAIGVRDELGLNNVPMIGLAKREEKIILSNGGFKIVDLPRSSPVIKLLQRVRDESHRFAVSYHSSLKRTHQTKNALEEINGIGSQTRKKLLRHFGSLRAVITASEQEIATIIGKSKAKLIKSQLV